MRNSLAAVLVLVAVQDSGFFKSFKGKAPPELASEKDGWLNADKPVTLKKMNGQVVLLNFSSIQVKAGKELTGYLSRWHADYSEQGLAVVVVNSPDDSQFDLREYAQKSRLGFPILWDKDGKNLKAYGITRFPATYLLGVDGKVLWEGFALDKIEELEQLIKDELLKVKKKDKK
jgi:peroxiredoxin